METPRRIARNEEKTTILRTKKSKMMVAAAKTIMQVKMTRLTTMSITAVSTISNGYTR
ncbi:MAG: hypothetical protein WCF90_06625 [Methanomicrobiales archaeon]